MSYYSAKKINSCISLFCSVVMLYIFFILRKCSKKKWFIVFILIYSETALSFPLISNKPVTALVVGQNYKHCRNIGNLAGCIQDANNMEDFIKTTFISTNTKVTKLTDEHKNLSGHTFLAEVEKLAERTPDGGQPIIYISGHGSYTQDDWWAAGGGDEPDGQDEVLVFGEHSIRDDQFRQALTKFNKTHSVLIISDTCHSGTNADLKYGRKPGEKIKTQSSRQRLTAKVISLSACLDSQVSLEKKRDGMNYGVFTHHLIKNKDLLSSLNVRDWQENLDPIIKDSIFESTNPQTILVSASFKRGLLSTTLIEDHGSPKKRQNERYGLRSSPKKTARYTP